MLQPWLGCWSCSVQQFLSHTWAVQGIQPGHRDTRSLESFQCPLPLQGWGLSPCLKVAHRHFKFLLLESTFFNDAGSAPSLSSSLNGTCPHQQALLPARPPSFNPSEAHPWAPRPVSGIPGTTSAAGEGEMIYEACWAHVWPADPGMWALPGPQMGRQNSPNLHKLGQKSGTLSLSRSVRSRARSGGR